MRPPLDEHDATPHHRKVFDRLLRLVTAPDRETWASFCDVGPDRQGCAKFRACPSHIKGVDARCWHSAAGAEKKEWCGEFDPSPGEESRYVVAYSFGVVCGSCGVRDKRGPAAGRRRQCAPPCPFFGCAVPGLRPRYENEKGPPVGCPYTPHEPSTRARGKDAERHANTFARVQCFISRPDFVRAQAEALGLHMGYFAFVMNTDEGTDLYYMARHHFKNLHLTHLVYDPRAGWSPDRFEHEKSYLFQASREGPEKVVDPRFLDRLRGVDDPDGVAGRPMSVFEREHDVLYVEDGEMTAYCLRWLLERGPELWGAAWAADDERLDLAAAAARGDDTEAWYAPGVDVASDEFVASEHPAGNAVERYLLERHLLPPTRDGLPGVLSYMGFTAHVTGLGLLEALGIVTADASDGSVLATERFWRLVRYLERNHPPEAAEARAHVDRFLTLADRQRRSDRSPSVPLTIPDVDALLLWVATATGLSASRAPMASTGIPGHIMLRRSFGGDTHGGRRQTETCARSWLVFPVYAYEPALHREGDQVRQVGFFIGTFDDWRCYGLDGGLDEDRLSAQVSEIRQWMHVVGSVEAAGTYVEDIVSRSSKAEGERDADVKWNSALRRARVLPEGDLLSPLRSASLIAARVQTQALVPLALQYSMAFDHPAWDLVAHDYRPEEGPWAEIRYCDAEVTQAYGQLAAVFGALIDRALETEAGRRLLDLEVRPHGAAPPGHAVRLLDTVAERLQFVHGLDAEARKYLGVIKDDPHSGVVGFKIGAEARLAALRDAAKARHGIEKADSSYAVPCDELYADLLAETFRDPEPKKGTFLAFGLPDPARGDAPAVGGGVYVFDTPLRRDAAKDAATVARKKSKQTNVDVRNYGIDQVFDIWVGCRSRDGNVGIVSHASRPLTRDGQRHAILDLFANAPELSQEGVYWLVVVPWLVHEEGKQRWSAASR